MSTFFQICSGRIEPEPMFIFGYTLKEMSIRAGHPVEHDSDGQPILPREMYSVTRDAIRRIK